MFREYFPPSCTIVTFIDGENHKNLWSNKYLEGLKVLVIVPSIIGKSATLELKYLPNVIV